MDKKHIAIIMDGNRRWAEQKKMPSFAGHRAGIDSLKKIVKICPSLNINYFSQQYFLRHFFKSVLFSFIKFTIFSHGLFFF